MGIAVTFKTISIIGGGPAGLMAAEILSLQGFNVSVYERKPSVGRKFLMAGRGGLNLTHSENPDLFIERYGSKAAVLRPVIDEFPPAALRAWCDGLGEKTFIGSSGRVFPQSLKASPLLRAWIARLEGQGVRFFLNHDWQGWEDGALIFKAPAGSARIKTDATLLALGGASWPRLGSDGSWVEILRRQGVDIAPLAPANCGFAADWSPGFSARYAGQPLKPVVASFGNEKSQGEIMITAKGLEGGAVYALSSALRDAISRDGFAELMLDLKPDLSREAIQERLNRPRGRLSLSNYLRKALNLSPVAVSLLMEKPENRRPENHTPQKLAQMVKQCPVRLNAPLPIERAISTSGGIAFDSLDRNYMLRAMPGVFAAGEMLDWEAPTGGYLLQASFATAVHAAKGIAAWLRQK